VIRTFDKEHKSCDSSLCSFLQSPVNYSLLAPNLPYFITYRTYFFSILITKSGGI
jgi:hypothetical protein